MRTASRRYAADALFHVDPDDAADAARLGAVVANLVPPARRGAMLVVLARIRRGWTQEQLAEASGLTRSQIARIEVSGAKIHRDRAERLADVLSVPADLLETT